MHLAIIVLNYKTSQTTIECLDSLLPFVEARDGVEILIVDNNSRDDSTERFSKYIKAHQQIPITLIESPDNGGFASGNNVAIKAVNADFYLLLNSDTLVRKDALDNLVSAVEDYPECKIYSPRLEWPDGRPQESCFVFHSPLSELIRSANTGLIAKIFNRYVVAPAVKAESSHPEWTSFACVMISSEVFKEIGLLDEEYFMYFEDVDFCARARNSGFRIVNVPESHVVHLRGGSSPVKSKSKLRKRLPRYFYESRTRYFYSQYGHFGLFAANTLWLVGWCIALARSAIFPSFRRKDCEKQWLDIWTNFYSPNKPFFHPDNY